MAPCLRARPREPLTEVNVNIEKNHNENFVIKSDSDVENKELLQSALTASTVTKRCASAVSTTELLASTKRSKTTGDSLESDVPPNVDDLAHLLAMLGLCDNDQTDSDCEDQEDRLVSESILDDTEDEMLAVDETNKTLRQNTFLNRLEQTLCACRSFANTIHPRHPSWINVGFTRALWSFTLLVVVVYALEVFRECVPFSVQIILRADSPATFDELWRFLPKIFQGAHWKALYAFPGMYMGLGKHPDGRRAWYIGSSCDLYRRICEHLRGIARRRNGDNREWDIHFWKQVTDDHQWLVSFRALCVFKRMRHFMWQYYGETAFILGLRSIDGSYEKTTPAILEFIKQSQTLVPWVSTPSNFVPLNRELPFVQPNMGQNRSRRVCISCKANEDNISRDNLKRNWYWYFPPGDHGTEEGFICGLCCPENFKDLLSNLKGPPSIVCTHDCRNDTTKTLQWHHIMGPCGETVSECHNCYNNRQRFILQASPREYSELECSECHCQKSIYWYRDWRKRKTWTWEGLLCHTCMFSHWHDLYPPHIDYSMLVCVRCSKKGTYKWYFVKEKRPTCHACYLKMWRE